jgi:hypothetical protein
MGINPIEWIKTIANPAVDNSCNTLDTSEYQHIMDAYRKCGKHPVVWNPKHSLGYYLTLIKLTNWCREHCHNAWMDVHHNAIKDDNNEYIFKELGGSRICFFIFDSACDAAIFALTWCT